MTDRVAAIFRVLAPPSDTRTDAELLAEFRAARDESAFAELLRRHGPMVLSVCRRLLPNPTDAEDAFQAAFLVLARRMCRLGTRPSVGPWLHRVAVLTARSLRRNNARRMARQGELPEAVPDPSPGPDSADLRLDLDAALLALPEKFRVPLVLCHLEGWTRRDAAERLGCPEGTLSSLLARGLAKLRDRFRGRDPAKVLTIPAAVVPALLATSTVRAATSAAVPHAVSRLVEGVIRMFWVKKATAASAALFVVFGLGVGVGVSVRSVPQAGAQDGPTDPTLVLNEQKPTDAAQEIAALKEWLAVEEEKFRSTRKGVDLTREKLKITEQLGDPKAIAADRDTLKQYEQKADAAAARIAEVKARIAALEARQQPGVAPQPKPDDVEKKLLEAQLRLKQLELDLKLLQTRVAENDAQRAQSKAQIELLEAEKRKVKPDATPKTPIKGPALEVRVGGDKAWWPCSLTEYGADGKPIGTLICDNTEVLRVTLARIAKDPNAPKDLRITVQEGATMELLKTTLDACKAAGFKTAIVTDGDPSRTLELKMLERSVEKDAEADLLNLLRSRDRMQQEEELLNLTRQRQKEDELLKLQLEKEELLKLLREREKEKLDPTLPKKPGM